MYSLNPKSQCEAEKSFKLVSIEMKNSHLIYKVYSDNTDIKGMKIEMSDYMNIKKKNSLEQ